MQSKLTYPLARPYSLESVNTHSRVQSKRSSQLLTYIASLLLSLSVSLPLSYAQEREIPQVDRAAQAAQAQGDEAPIQANQETTATVKDTSTDAAPAPQRSRAAPPAVQIKLSDLKRQREEVSLLDRARGGVGLILLLLVCWLMSNNRAHVPWRVIGWGLGLQFTLGWVVIKTSAGASFFGLVNGAFTKLLQFSNDGAQSVFGNLAKMNNVPVGVGGPFGPVSDTGQVAHIGSIFAFSVLPTIIFFSSLMAILYHLGVMEWVVKSIAWVMQKTMRTSGSETLSVSGNIFVGQTEAPLLVRPYLNKMTESELMVVMTGGFATVAGGVMAAYIGMFNQWFPDIAGHLLSASVMSAPAALICAKLIIPELDPTRSETYGDVKVKFDKVDVNLIDAAARGAADGLKLALNVGGMLLAFMGLVYLFNYLLAIPSYLQHASTLSSLRESVMSAMDAQALSDALSSAPQCLNAPSLAWESAGACVAEVDQWVSASGAPAIKALEPAAPTLWSVISWQSILGVILQPIAWLMGVSWDQAQAVGQLLGVKTILNEFVAYSDLVGMLARGEVSGRSAVIAIYALCGFANFGAIAIQLGGIGGVAPNRKSDLARLGLKAMIGGGVAAMMTATIAGILY